MTAHDKARPVVRFSLDQDGLGVYEDPTGDYVLFEDYEALEVLRAGVERLRAKADEHRDGRLAALEQAAAAEARVSRVEELAASLTYSGKWANADNEDQTKHVCAELIRAALNDQGQGNG
ncbi:hypothetical protein RDV84_23270 [Lysobacter yananisis]|uniref:Uncharacterized protein n=1 Tax=Lysobacter yananisis TaxID=1003114 RepID=A0ABY9P914_9GAMM|nr:hypothetical protein [Lysobacter yananisis]WMT02848.1 hypothetical protein RDV84_23270 [Lysobacter yananisis]